MTEADWLTATTKPMAMFRQARLQTPHRKYQLMACGCCRLLWELITDSRLRIAVEHAERFSDGECTEEAFATARSGVRMAQETLSRSSNDTSDIEPEDVDHTALALEAASCVVEAAMFLDVIDGLERAIAWSQTAAAAAAFPDSGVAAQRKVRDAVCVLFREVIGNPFRPWTVNPDFLGGGLVQPDGRVVSVSATARGLAEAIRAEQAYDRLPVLADAVEESGVTDREMLDHLRHGTGHVRGCWALDLILGKG